MHKIAPRSPHRRGRQTKQAKARQARRLGSWSVLPNDGGFRREVRYLAALMRLAEKAHPILLLRANDLGFRAKNCETEVAARSDAALIKGLILGIPRKVSPTSVTRLTVRALPRARSRYALPAAGPSWSRWRARRGDNVMPSARRDDDAVTVRAAP